MLNNFHKRIKNKFSVQRGLTLVELMVVISIFLIITSVTIFNYGNFNSNISLQNLTDDIALSIRKAQSFAIGARGIVHGTEEADFGNSYGMHFSMDTEQTGSLSGSKKSFLMFSVPKSDLNKMYKYDSGSMNDICNDNTNKCMELFNITSIDEIKEIIVDGVSMSSGSVDIVFTRPDPRAYFCYRANITSSVCSYAPISRVGIIVSNGQTDPKLLKAKLISIQNTGQISIEPYAIK